MPCNDGLYCDYNSQGNVICINNERRTNRNAQEMQVFGDNNNDLQTNNNSSKNITTIVIIIILIGLIILTVALWYFCYKKNKQYTFGFTNYYGKRGRHEAIGDDEDDDDDDDDEDDNDIIIKSIGSNIYDENDGNATQVIVANDDRMYNPNNDETEGNISDDDENATLNGTHCD